MNAVDHPVYLEQVLQEISTSGRLRYRSHALPTWCPGCGYFSIAESLTDAFNRLRWKTEDTVIVSGIGCASRMPFFSSTYGFHAVHGRALPIATGIKVAREQLNVVVVGGDGDGFAIGGAHIPHVARRNVDLTYILFDNGIYGLTKGQTSPTSALGFHTSTTPYGNPDLPLNPILMLLAYGASWVAQAYAGQPHQLTDLVEQALSHRGFSYLHVISPCVTFDKTDRTYKRMDTAVRDLPDTHDATSLEAATREARDLDTPALGVYFNVERATLGDGLNTVAEHSQQTHTGDGDAPARA